MTGKILFVRFVDCVPSAGCDFNPGCPYILMGTGCRNALERIECEIPARTAILDGLGSYQRGMRKRRNSTKK